MSTEDRPEPGDRPVRSTERAPAQVNAVLDAEPDGHRAALPGSENDGDTGDGAPLERRGLRRVLISLSVLGLVLALVAGGGLWFLTNRYAGNINRVSDVFSGLDEGARPAPATPDQPAKEDPVTFLLDSETL